MAIGKKVSPSKSQFAIFDKRIEKVLGLSLKRLVNARRSRQHSAET